MQLGLGLSESHPTGRLSVSKHVSQHHPLVFVNHASKRTWVESHSLIVSRSPSVYNWNVVAFCLPIVDHLLRPFDAFRLIIFTPYWWLSWGDLGAIGEDAVCDIALEGLHIHLVWTTAICRKLSIVVSMNLPRGSV